MRLHQVQTLWCVLVDEQGLHQTQILHGHEIHGLSLLAKTPQCLEGEHRNGHVASEAERHPEKRSKGEETDAIISGSEGGEKEKKDNKQI